MRSKLKSLGFRWLRRRRGNRGRLSAERGTVATEFALLAPLMLTALLGSFATFDTVRTYQRVDDTAAIVADLVARQSAMTDSRKTSVLAAGEALLSTKFDSQKLTIKVSSISRSADDELEIDWTFASAGDGLDDPADVDLPNIPIGESVIAVQVEGLFSPAIAYGAVPAMTLSASSVHRPRFTSKIDYD